MAEKTAVQVGIDEVGRGSLAGPVTVAVVALGHKIKTRLRDSKKLSARQREKWFHYIKNHPRIFYATASVYPKVIDRINISQAANLAATRACKKLISNFHFPISKIRIFLDGGLYLYKNRLTTNTQNLKAKTIIKGDEKYNCIKLASIVAKVKRDRIMKRNHKKYPEYGFDDHKGYGTKAHIRAIKRHGPSSIHRLTFLKKLIKIV